MRLLMHFTFLLLLVACGNRQQQPNADISKKDTIVAAPTVINKDTSTKWWGKWERNIWQNDANINIDKVTKDSLHFSLFAGSGGHTGELEGTAAIKGNTAIYYDAEEYDTCTLVLALTGDSIITVKQTGDCGAGMGVTYEGEYKNEKITSGVETPDFVDLLGISRKDDDLLQQLTGDKYDLFITTTQLTNSDTDIDNLHAKVYASGVRGLFTSMENIIMLDEAQHIWAAVIDLDVNMVRYYTNVPAFKHKLPLTIEKWRERFKQFKVLYMSK